MAKKRKLDPDSDLPADESLPTSDDPPPTSSDEPLPTSADDHPPTSSDEPPPTSHEPPPTASDVPPSTAAEETESVPTASPPLTTIDDPISEEVQDPPPTKLVSEPNGSADPEPESETELVRDLLEPLSKEQLLDLLLRAASRHPDVTEEIQSVAGNDPAHRKIFVHGLGWDTSTETLVSAFSEYGEIEDCNAVKDKISGKSKGYGFILFKHRNSARKALKEPQKKIGSRMTACQLASAGPVPAPAPPVSEYTQRKIYVSNVGTDIDPQKLLQFFAKYGEIEEGPLGLDRQTGKPKGFCLFVYKTVEGARKALEEPHKTFEGHVLHCQKAIDGPKLQKVGWSQPASWGGQQQGGGSYSGGHHAKSTGYGGGMAGRAPSSAAGHLMAPSQSGIGYNQSAQPATVEINPTLGQALTALLTSPGAGLGLTNLLGSLGSSGQVGNQGVPSHIGNSGGYANQGAGVGGGYARQSYGAGRGQHGGHLGGGPPYMGR